MKFRSVILSLFIVGSSLGAAFGDSNTHGVQARCSNFGQSCRSTPCCGSSLQCDYKSRTCKYKPSQRCKYPSDCCSPNTCVKGYCRTESTQPAQTCSRTLGQSCSASSKTSCCKTGSTCQGGKCCVQRDVKGCGRDSDCCTYGDKCDKGVCVKKSSGGGVGPGCTAMLGNRCQNDNVILTKRNSGVSCCKTGKCGSEGICCIATSSSGCRTASDCCDKTSECSQGTCAPKTVLPEPKCSVSLGGMCDSTSKCCMDGFSCSTSTSTCCIDSGKSGCSKPTDCCKSGDICLSGSCGSCISTSSSGCSVDGDCCGSKDGVKCKGNVCTAPCATEGGSCANGGCCAEGLTCKDGTTCAKPCATEGNSCANGGCCQGSLECRNDVCSKPCAAVNGDCSNNGCCQGSLECRSNVCSVPCATEGNSCANGGCCQGSLECRSDVCSKPCASESGDCSNGGCCTSGLSCVSNVCTKPPTCNTGPIQCCQKFTTASDPVAGLIIGLLGIVIKDQSTHVGLTCSPMSGVSSGCSASVVCCKNNSFNGLIAIDCATVQA